MSSINRLRPSNDLTIEELKKPYLWFSRPSEYKDTEDSNIFSFIDSNEQILDSFERVYKDFKEVAKLAAMSGICSFTKAMQPINLWKKFPKSHNGILVEYDREIIDNHFIKSIGFGNCFQDVEYSTNPILFDSHNEAILWEKNEEMELFKPMRLIESDPKLMDQFFLKMFTRISSKYSDQNEVRIILGGRNVPSRKQNLKGYKVSIPKDAIVKIYTHPEASGHFVRKIKALGLTVEKAK